MMTITYEYQGGLYVNLTNKCDCRCVFCIRSKGGWEKVSANNLWLEREPSKEEALADILSRDLTKYNEIVFCGFGEPTFRFDDMMWICDQIRAKLAHPPILRLNTNGHGNLICGRKIAPEMKGRLDVVSVSLNASNSKEYCEKSRPRDGEKAFEATVDFIRESVKILPRVIVSVVDMEMPQEEIEACRRLTESLGATYRVREFTDE